MRIGVFLVKPFVSSKPTHIFPQIMVIMLSVVGAVFLVGSLMLLWANFNAVEGYEDEEGFHTGRRTKG